MRIPKLSQRRDTDAESAPDAAAAAEVARPDLPGPGYRSVALPAAAPPPLTSELTRSIRFTISEPQGYYFDQVETFVQQVIDALSYYEQTDYRWRQAVYEMQVEMDQQAYDLQRSRSEIELFKVQGSPLVNADGSYVTESQAASIEALTTELAAAQAALEERDSEVARLHGVAATTDQQIVSTRAWAAQVSAEAEDMRQRLAAAVAEIAALRTENDALRAVAVEPAAVPPVASEPAAVESVAVEPVAVEPVMIEEADEGVIATPSPSVPFIAALSVSVDEDAFDGEDYSDEDPDTEDPDPVGLYAENPSAVEEDVTEPVAPEASTEAPVTQAAESDVPFTEAEAEARVHPAGDQEEAVHPDPAETVGVTADLADTASDTPEVESQAASDIEPAQSSEDDHADVSGTEPDEDEGAEAVHDPYAEYDAALREEPSGPTIAIVPVDSELPEGTELPGTGEAVHTYPPAAPDLPLDTHGILVEVWAPELHPKVLRKIAKARSTPAEDEMAEEPEGLAVADGDAAAEALPAAEAV